MKSVLVAFLATLIVVANSPPRHKAAASLAPYWIHRAAPSWARM